MGGFSGWGRTVLAAIALVLLGTGAWAAGPAPASVALVNPAADSAGFETGMVQVTFADGHREIFDKSDKCARPKIRGR